MKSLGGIFDFDAKRKRLEEINTILQDPEIWSNQEKSQKLGKEKSSSEKLVNLIENLSSSIKDLNELFELVGNDEVELNQLEKDLLYVEEMISDLEFRRMFSGKLTRQVPILTFSLVREERKHKIGQKCYCVCT